jgi:transcriptional regulator GlxA family with amidase domain
MAARDIVIVVFPNVQTLDVAGPVDAFDAANHVRRRTEYRLTVAGAEKGPVRSAAGLGITVDAALSDIGSADTLIVAGGSGARVGRSPRLVEQVRRLGPACRRVASVCTGAYVLAEAGLLDGRRATTHWSWCGDLARRYPAIAVESDPIYVRDGNVYTSAGVTAGIDLALALVEDDLGRDVALAVARQLVMFLRRPANQSQFSAQLSAQLSERDALRDVQRVVAEHPEADLTVPVLAELASMSERNFARAFKQEIGVTPGRYVEQVRLEAARRLLEDTSEPVAAVASSCGFGTAETMRRSFLRALGCAPAEYRRRFTSGAA